MSPKTVSGWENGSREPDIATLVALAQFLGTSTAYLVGETDDPRPILQPGQAAHNAADPYGGSDLTPEDHQDLERAFLEIERRREERRRSMKDGDGAR